MSDRMEYQVELLKDGRFDVYQTASLFADTEAEAVQTAKAWAASFDSTPEDAWLQVSMSGKDICNLRPGEFNA
jgi:hypothetical protein